MIINDTKLGMKINAAYFPRNQHKQIQKYLKQLLIPDISNFIHRFSRKHLMKIFPACIFTESKLYQGGFSSKVFEI